MKKDKRFEVYDCDISGIKIIQRKPIVDERGVFERIYCATELEKLLGIRPLRQINRSFNLKGGTLRGMHFQLYPCQDAKIVTCTKGSVVDVVLDLREGSRTFGSHFKILLKSETYISIYIPTGFAHGFQTLEDNSELLYLHDESFSLDHQAGINPLDPELGIGWCKEVSLISDRDFNLPNLSSLKNYDKQM